MTTPWKTRPLGVRYYQTYDVLGKLSGYDVIVYTDADETTYHGPTLVEALDATPGHGNSALFRARPDGRVFQQ